jgi:hypothetical protein
MLVSFSLSEMATLARCVSDTFSVLALGCLVARFPDRVLPVDISRDSLSLPSLVSASLIHASILNLFAMAMGKRSCNVVDQDGREGSYRRILIHATT